MEHSGAPLGPERTVGERGSSLIEVLLAILLASLVLLGVMAGLVTTIRASATNNHGVTAASALVAITEQAKHLPYTPCGGSTPPAAAYADRLSSPVPRTADGRPIVVRVDAVAYWDDAPTNPRFRSTCPTAGDAGVQRVDLTVVVGEGRASGSLVVRNPQAVPR